jgi:hypothetical protein
MFEFSLMGQTYREVTDPTECIGISDLLYFFDTHPDRDAFCYMFIMSDGHLVGFNWLGYKAGLMGSWSIHENDLRDNGGRVTLGWLEKNWGRFSSFPRAKTKFLKWQERDYDPNEAVDAEFFKARYGTD